MSRSQPRELWADRSGDNKLTATAEKLLHNFFGELRPRLSPEGTAVTLHRLLFHDSKQHFKASHSMEMVEKVDTDLVVGHS